MEFAVAYITIGAAVSMIGAGPAYRRAQQRFGRVDEIAFIAAALTIMLIWPLAITHQLSGGGEQ
jgi:hypothetical protein